MTGNGYDSYDLTGQLEFWSNEDLIRFVEDSETMMELEKHHVVRLAQEIAMRFTPFSEQEYDDSEDDDDDDNEYGRRFHGREFNEG